MRCLFALPLILALLTGVAPARAQQVNPTLDPEFRPELAGVDFTSRRLRPGDRLSLTLRFRNAGTRPAKSAYNVFVHLEHPDGCENIRVNADHPPIIPTYAWGPAGEHVDGPHSIRVPADAEDGKYRVHVGVFDPAGGGRLMEAVVPGGIEVSRIAPPADALRPASLPALEVGARRRRLTERLKQALSLTGPGYRFDVEPRTGAWALVDTRTGVEWHSDPIQARLGSVALTNGQRTLLLPIGTVAAQRDSRGLELTASLAIPGESTRKTVRVRVDPVQKPDGVRLSWSEDASGPWKVQSIRLLERSLCVTEADAGAYAVPRRLGVLMRPDEDLPSIRRLGTYTGQGGVSMSMFGAIQRGSALLVAWDDPYVTLEVQRAWMDQPLLPGRQALFASLELTNGARAITLHPLGRGGYVECAAAYRELATRRGYRVPWKEKRRTRPSVDQIIGAADFKPFVLTRTVRGSRYNTGDTDRVSVGYTFAETGQLAEYWRTRLGIDRAMVVLAGWIRRGYDNQHPDVLPAAPECGGNEALAKAGAQIKAQGYLFGLHDNYQDMYEDAPSFDVKHLRKGRDGKPLKGGNWAGGQAWQVRPQSQVELALRPNNYPAIKRLFAPTIYFVDTVFAWSLVDSAYAGDPWDKRDDLKWKTELCRVSREHFGLFGSEEGYEWAVPVADYLEGIFSHKTRDDGSETIIPLFPMVYGDCANLYTHQSERVGREDARKVLDHILYAEMPIYQFGRGLYYNTKDSALPLRPSAEVKPAGPNAVDITYRWQVSGTVPADMRAFVHLTHPTSKHEEKIAAQDDHALTPPSGQWRSGQTVTIGPRRVTLPANLTGEMELLIGLSSKGERQTLEGMDAGKSRYRLGKLNLTPAGITFTPEAGSGEPARPFARGDNGWGRDLNTTDRVIKNTYEVLSWLNRVTAETPMTSHAFLTPDGRVQRTRFGAVEVVVNYGPGDYAWKGTGSVLTEALLPPNGFVVAGPEFVAFHATRANGIEYPAGALFTARSTDGKPLAQASKVRVFHGFGPTTLRLRGKNQVVEREAVVTP